MPNILIAVSDAAMEKLRAKVATAKSAKPARMDNAPAFRRLDALYGAGTPEYKAAVAELLVSQRTPRSVSALAASVVEQFAATLKGAGNLRAAKGAVK
jgi:hypothetical protein